MHLLVFFKRCIQKMLPLDGISQTKHKCGRTVVYKGCLKMQDMKNFRSLFSPEVSQTFFDISKNLMIISNLRNTQMALGHHVFSFETVLLTASGSAACSDAAHHGHGNFAATLLSQRLFRKSWMFLRGGCRHGGGTTCRVGRVRAAESPSVGTRPRYTWAAVYTSTSFKKAVLAATGCEEHLVAVHTMSRHIAGCEDSPGEFQAGLFSLTLSDGPLNEAHLHNSVSRTSSDHSSDRTDATWET